MPTFRITALLIASAASGAFAHENVTSIKVSGDMTCISSNGAPNHEMGLFPNRANPNAF